MGYEVHHTIVISSWHEDLLKEAHDAACEIFDSVMVSPIVGSIANGIGSFFVGPDGSKDGWPESDRGDEQREHFVDWLNSQRYDDDSTCLNWVEVSFGEDEYKPPRIINDGNEIARMHNA